MELFVIGFPLTLTDAGLRKIFEVYGEVESASVIIDRATGISRGFGFVNIADEKEAKKVMTRLNGETIEGCRLTVKEARPMKKAAPYIVPRKWQEKAAHEGQM